VITIAAVLQALLAAGRSAPISIWDNAGPRIKRQLVSMPMLRTPWLAAALLLVLLVARAGAEPDGPEAPVERLNAALLEVMQEADTLGYEGRFATLEPVLEEVFDFPAMTRIAVGRTWRELEEAQRARLVELFGEMSVANFAARFDGYDGERFEITGTEPGPRDTVLVKSRLVLPDEAPVGLDYLLRDTDSGWQAIDVFLDSKFSELARQRAEFASVLRDGGYPQLVASLERKIEDLASGG